MHSEEDTIFEDVSTESGELAHVDFDLLETTGRWLLKVVSGPNTGAEFSMQPGTSYLIGTDTTSCDVVFHDLSVSRQHARLTIDTHNHVFLEDTDSRNGTFLEGEKITQKTPMTANALITCGTTTFMLIDREGERKTIVSPLMNSLDKQSTQKNTIPDNTPSQTPQASNAHIGAIHQAVLAPIQSEVDRIKEEERKKEKHAHALSALAILAGITGLFLLIGLGTMMLFRTQEVTHTKESEADTAIHQALKDYPSIRYSFNPSNGRLLLIGHVRAPVDRKKILDNLDQLTFISQIDSSNIVIDEYVWKEINQILSKNPAWKGVAISSPGPGKFVLTGYLKTRKQAAALSDYIAQNFNYSDLLDTKVIVEEDLQAEINQQLTASGFHNVKVSLHNGEVVFTGMFTANALEDFTKLLSRIKTIPGVRSVQSFATESASDQSTINISDKYQVSGYSSEGKNINVVINGRILTVGDTLDGMTITQISHGGVLLEKDGFKYRIDFNR